MGTGSACNTESAADTQPAPLSALDNGTERPTSPIASKQHVGEQKPKPEQSGQENKGEAPTAAAQASPPSQPQPEVVRGQRISVFWEDDEEWYSGTVTAVSEGRASGARLCRAVRVSGAMP